MSRKKQTTQRTMVSHIAYRFYGVPTEDDAILEAKTFGCCRFLWKSEREGKYLIKIDRWFPSSKTCCKCGHVHKELTLSDRTYISAA